MNILVYSSFVGLGNEYYDFRWGNVGHSLKFQFSAPFPHCFLKGLQRANYNNNAATIFSRKLLWRLINMYKRINAP